MTDHNAAKITNLGWPDPNDWVNRLYQRMAHRQEVYEQETDPLLRRNKAGGMLAEVIHSLMEFPPFQREPVHFPLKDLLHVLADLDQGRSHDWARPLNVGGTSLTNTADGELRAWVKAVFMVLTSNNFRKTEAYKRIAVGLNKSGRHGRKETDPVRWQTVGEWCRSDETLKDSVIRERMERWWVEFRSDIQRFNLVDSSDNPVPDPGKAIAGEFADRCWDLKHLRD